MAPPSKKRKVLSEVEETASSPNSGSSSSNYTTSELCDARLIAAVHCSDLRFGSTARNWTWIKGAAGIEGEMTDIISRFKELKKPTAMWFPYPPIPLCQFVETEERSPKIPVEQEIPYSEYQKTYGDKPWAYGVEQIRRAAIIVKPWALQTWQIQHFLGYFEKPKETENSLTVFYDRYQDALMYLPGDRLKEFAQYYPDEEFSKSDEEIEDELEKLIQNFKIEAKRSVRDVTTAHAVLEITDVSYYRRKLYTKCGKFLRKILSDYEIVKLYMKGVKAGFDFETYEYELWEELLETNGVTDMGVFEAREDFFKYGIPRMDILRRCLAKDKDDVQLTIKSNSPLISRIVYHFAKDYTYYGILRAMFLLEKNNVIETSVFGGIGIHHSVFCFILMMLQCDAEDLSTYEMSYYRARVQVIHDLLDNYCRFHCNYSKAF